MEKLSWNIPDTPNWKDDPESLKGWLIRWKLDSSKILDYEKKEPAYKLIIDVVTSSHGDSNFICFGPPSGATEEEALEAWERNPGELTQIRIGGTSTIVDVIRKVF